MSISSGAVAVGEVKERAQIPSSHAAQQPAEVLPPGLSLDY